MLIDNRHGGPIHIPHEGGFLSLPPGISEVAEAIWNAATKSAEGAKLPPVLRDILRTSLSVVESETVEESPLSIIPRIFDRALLAPFLSHEDQSVRKAALEQDDLIKSRTGG
jgi:hypothetical protein